MTETELSKFKGNRLTDEEKKFRVSELTRSIETGLIDEEFIPFLHQINALPFFVTTQCCTGHGEEGNTAHVDFRCSLPVEDVIDLILRPLESSLGLGVTLMLEEQRCRYVLWLDNASWEGQIKEVIKLMKKVQDKASNHYPVYGEDAYVITEYLQNFLKDSTDFSQEFLEKEYPADILFHEVRKLVGNSVMRLLNNEKVNYCNLGQDLRLLLKRNERAIQKSHKL